MMTVVAIDDEPLGLEIIKAFCANIDFVRLVKTFTDSASALEFLNGQHVDLLLLDINMPAMSGIELYKKVSKDTMVIFTTAYSHYAVEGFNLSAIDYLLKPFEFGRFQKALEKANEYKGYTQRKETEEQKFLFVRVDYSMVKVVLEEVLYIEGLDNYIKIHFDNGKSLLVRMSMKGIAEKLPSSEFIRVHRSFIVPVTKVTSVRNKIIYLNKQEIPVGTNYVDEVIPMFKNL